MKAALLQSLTYCFSILKSNDRQQHKIFNKTLTKLLDFALFCHQKKLLEQANTHPIELLGYTVDNEVLTTWFVNILLRTSNAVAIICVFVPQYTLIYKHLLNSFNYDLVKLEKFLIQEAEKFSSRKNSEGHTIKDLIAAIEEIFSEHKSIVSFYEQWKTLNKDILDDSLKEKSFFELGSLLKKESSFDDTVGIALGGLAFIFDLHHILTGEINVMTSFVAKMVALQAYLGNKLTNNIFV